MKQTIGNNNANDKNTSTVTEEIYSWIQCCVIAILAFVFVTIFLFRVTEVDGLSMYPTLEDGDRVVVSNIAYNPKQGDVVVFACSNFDEPLVKRVIATEGQIVDIEPESGSVTVNGEIMEEDYINEETHILYDVQFPVTVPEGCLFVMGDNRNYSTDSRASMVGMVDSREVIGKVYGIIAPFDNFGSV